MTAWPVRYAVEHMADEPGTAAYEPGALARAMRRYADAIEEAGGEGDGEDAVRAALEEMAGVEHL